MICRMLTLFKMFVEIIFLRKSPSDIPHSPVLFVMVAAIWLSFGFVAVLLGEDYRSSGLVIDLILAAAGMGLYAGIVYFFGYRARLLQCLTAILGCSIVFSIVLFFGRLLLPLLLAETEANWLVQLIWFWSIPVEGHIIARTIERQWFVGFLFALVVLFAQLQLFTVVKPLLESVG